MNFNNKDLELNPKLGRSKLHATETVASRKLSEYHLLKTLDWLSGQFHRIDQFPTYVRRMNSPSKDVGLPVYDKYQNCSNAEELILCYQSTNIETVQAFLFSGTFGRVHEILIPEECLINNKGKIGYLNNSGFSFGDLFFEITFNCLT